MVIAIFILGVVFVTLFVYMCFLTQAERKKERKQMIDTVRRIDLASAGSDGDGCHLRKKSVEVASVDTTVYTDEDGNVLNPKDYSLFIIDGNSMKLCGIHDRNLIFVTKNFNISEAKDFPIILVLSKKRTNAETPAFKVRRTWVHLSFSDVNALMEALKDIVKSDSFQEIRNLSEYPGDNFILDDFMEKRLHRYMEEYINCENPNPADRDLIISTTLNTDSNMIHFSIHPVSRIYGEVIAAFDMSNDQFLDT